MVDTPAGGVNRPVRQAFPDEVDAFASNPGLMEDDRVEEPLTAEIEPALSLQVPSVGAAAPAGDADAEDDGFTPELLTRARDQGFTETEARAFDDPDALSRSLRALDRRMVGMHKQSQARVPQSAPTTLMTPELAAALQQPRVPSAPQAAGAKPAYEVVLDADVVDESVIKAVKGMNEHYAKQNAVLQQAVAGLINQSQQPPPVDMSQRNNELDDFVSGLGEEWQDIFGKGTVGDIDPYSEHFARRNKLGVARIDIEGMLQGKNGTTPPAMQVLNRALHLSFGDEFEGIARKKVDNRVKRRREGASHPPTRRASKPVDAEGSARETAAQIFKDRGIPDTSAGMTREQELYAQ